MKQYFTLFALMGWMTYNDVQAATATVENFSCTMQLQNCQRETGYLEKYDQAMKDKTVANGWAMWKSFLADSDEARKYYEGRRAAWEKANPVTPDGDSSDDDDTDTETETETDTDDNNSDDDDLPWVTQQAVNKSSCNGSLVRHLREGGSRIKVEGQLFNDKSFPADHSSIDWGKKRTMTWLRPTEVEKSPKLYGKNGIHPGAVNQGGLGDCWYLAAMAAVGEWPDRIKKIFNGQSSYPKNGQFTLNLYTYGVAQRVTIDDKIPGKKYGSRFYPAFTKQGKPGGAWWGPLLEKGGAKYWGHYQRMSGGWMGDAFDMLTGMPTTNFSNRRLTADQIWNKIKQMDEKHMIMSAGCFKTQKDMKNLVTGHAYTVLGKAEYKGEKLIKMRNPWGSERYKGTWGDSDTKKWTADAKKALKHTTQNDGTFFVPLADFKVLFSGISGLNYKEWKRGHMMSAWDRTKPASSIKHTFNNPTAQSVSLQLAAPQGRMFKDNRCKSAERSESIVYSVRKVGTRSNFKTVEGGDYAWTRGWLNIAKLPAGDYEFYVRQNNRPQNGSGSMKYGLVALGENQAPTWKA